MKNHFLFLLCSLWLYAYAQAQSTEFNLEKVSNKKKNSRCYKSPKLALVYSLTNTIIPTVGGSYLYCNTGKGLLLAFYGITIGPSIGNIYSKDYKRGFAGIGLRLFLEYIILQEAIGEAISLVGDGSNYSTTTPVHQKFICCMIFGSAIYNIVTAPKSAREFNFEHKFSVTPRITFSKQKIVINFSINL